jgi:hypothetical protein
MTAIHALKMMAACKVHVLVWRWCVRMMVILVLPTHVTPPVEIAIALQRMGRVTTATRAPWMINVRMARVSAERLCHVMMVTLARPIRAVTVNAASKRIPSCAMTRTIAVWMTSA